VILKKMEIKFNKNIYKKEAIQKTKEAYKDLAKIDLIESDEYFIIKVESIDKIQEDVLLNEFNNYLIYEMKKCL